MAKKSENITPVAEKIAITEIKQRAGIIRKSFALTPKDLANIALIKDKCLNQKVVLSDSHTVRLALELAVNLSEQSLAGAIIKSPHLPTGRPRKK